MKLKKNSWHYRLWEKSFTPDCAPERTSIWPYWLRVMFMSLQNSMNSLGATLYIVTCFALLFLGVSLLVASVFGLDRNSALVWMSMGVAASAILPFLAVALLMSPIGDLFAWCVRAAFRRVCPIVEFED